MSGAEIVHPVPASEAEPWIRAFASTLLQDPHEPHFAGWVERWAGKWRPERIWGVRDHGRWVGSLATEERVLTVPAPAGTTRDCTVDALTAVSVAATHRRQGLLTRMISQSLQAAKERGDALGALIAAEWPIYGRFGYGPAALSASHTYRPRMRGATITPAGSGTVRQVEPEELLQVAPGVFDWARRLRAGQIDRADPWWARTLGVGYAAVAEPLHWMLHEGPLGPDGLLGWRATRDFELDGRFGAIRVESMVAATEEAYRDLWAYLGSIDVIDEVTLRNRPVDEPARFLMADGRALEQTYAGDFLWLRLLDVPAALSMRGYTVHGRAVLELVDDSPGSHASGRFELDAGPDGASCRPTTRTADVTLPAQHLAAAYLGAHTLTALRHSGAVEEARPGAVMLLDAMLATPLAPWCQTGF